MSPAWSPDGRTIAFYGSLAEGDARRQVWLVSLDGGDERRLTSEDEEVGSFPLARSAPPIWSLDSRSVTVLAAHATSCAIARIDVASGEQRRIVDGERQITLVAASERGDRLAFVSATLRVCGLVSLASFDGANERLVLDANEGWKATKPWPRASLRDFASANEHVNHGLLLLPAEGDGPWPLLVDVHGGPQSYVELGYPYHPYWFVFASLGWAVLSINPVGSASYGKEHSDRLQGRWGEADLPEHLAAIDGLVREGIVDGDRVAICGKSYGGYMAAWAIGKTNRFRAAVCSAGVTNLRSHFGTSDSGYYVDPRDLGVEPHEDADRYDRLSPIRCAHEAVTPTLILQGEEDQRCPIGQAEELFAALNRAGKTEVEMVLYPGGSHRLAETGRPSHRVDYNRRIVTWVQTHSSGVGRNGV